MKRPLKLISLLLIGALLAEQLVWADAWSPRPLALKPAVEDLQLSPEIALVEDGSRSVSGRKIYLIQDAHTNESGQRNIAAALQHLMKRDPRLRWVFVEAGSGDDSLTIYRSQIAPVQMKMLTTSLFKKGLLHGAEYLDLTSTADFKIWGVEDFQLYDQALEAYRDVARDRERLMRYLGQIRSTVEVLGPSTFDPILLRWEEGRGGLARGKTGLVDYLEVLIQTGEAAGLDLSAYPHLLRFAQLRDREKSIDFERASKERLLAVEALPPADRQDLEDLARSHKALQAGGGFKPEETGYFAALRARLSQNPVSAIRYPELFKYFDYLSSASKLAADSLLQEKANLENRLEDQLPQDRNSRLLLRSAVLLRDLEGLLAIQLTPEDFVRYREHARDFGIRELTGFLNARLAERQGPFERAVFLEPGWDQTILKAEKFYKLTRARDEAFIRNLSAKMSAEKASSAVLIAGGYHSSNLKSLLKRAGFGFVSIRPQIYAETNQSRYEQILLGQKWPVSPAPPASFMDFPQAREGRTPVLGQLIAATRLSRGAQGASYASRLARERSDFFGPRYQLFHRFLAYIPAPRQKIVQWSIGRLMKKFEDMEDDENFHGIFLQMADAAIIGLTRQRFGLKFANHYSVDAEGRQHGVGYVSDYMMKVRRGSDDTEWVVDFIHSSEPQPHTSLLVAKAHEVADFFGWKWRKAAELRLSYDVKTRTLEIRQDYIDSKHLGIQDDLYFEVLNRTLSLLPEDVIQKIQFRIDETDSLFKQIKTVGWESLTKVMSSYENYVQTREPFEYPNFDIYMPNYRHNFLTNQAQLIRNLISYALSIDPNYMNPFPEPQTIAEARRQLYELTARVDDGKNYSEEQLYKAVQLNKNSPRLILSLRASLLKILEQPSFARRATKRLNILTNGPQLIMSGNDYFMEIKLPDQWNRRTLPSVTGARLSGLRQTLQVLILAATAGVMSLAASVPSAFSDLPQMVQSGRSAVESVQQATSSRLDVLAKSGESKSFRLSDDRSVLTVETDGHKETLQLTGSNLSAQEAQQLTTPFLGSQEARTWASENFGAAEGDSVGVMEEWALGSDESAAQESPDTAQASSNTVAPTPTRTTTMAEVLKDAVSKEGFRVSPGRGLRIRTADGRTKLVYIPQDKNGVAVIVDLTEPKVLEDPLRNNPERIKTVSRDAAAGLIDQPKPTPKKPSGPKGGPSDEEKAKRLQEARDLQTIEKTVKVSDIPDQLFNSPNPNVRGAARKKFQDLLPNALSDLNEKAKKAGLPAKQTLRTPSELREFESAIERSQADALQKEKERLAKEEAVKKGLWTITGVALAISMILVFGTRRLGRRLSAGSESPNLSISQSPAPKAPSLHVAQIRNEGGIRRVQIGRRKDAGASKMQLINWTTWGGAALGSVIGIAAAPSLWIPILSATGAVSLLVYLLSRLAQKPQEADARQEMLLSTLLTLALNSKTHRQQIVREAEADYPGLSHWAGSLETELEPETRLYFEEEGHLSADELLTAFARIWKENRRKKNPNLLLEVINYLNQTYFADVPEGTRRLFKERALGERVTPPGELQPAPFDISEPSKGVSAGTPALRPSIPAPIPNDAKPQIPQPQSNLSTPDLRKEKKPVALEATPQGLGTETKMPEVQPASFEGKPEMPGAQPASPAGETKLKQISDPKRGQEMGPSNIPVVALQPSLKEEVFPPQPISQLTSKVADPGGLRQKPEPSDLVVSAHKPADPAALPVKLELLPFAPSAPAFSSVQMKVPAAAPSVQAGPTNTELLTRFRAESKPKDSDPTRPRPEQEPLAPAGLIQSPGGQILPPIADELTSHGEQIHTSFDPQPKALAEKRDTAVTPIDVDPTQMRQEAGLPRLGFRPAAPSLPFFPAAQTVTSQPIGTPSGNVQPKALGSETIPVTPEAAVTQKPAMTLSSSPQRDLPSAPFVVSAQTIVSEPEAPVKRGVLSFLPVVEPMRPVTENKTIADDEAKIGALLLVNRLISEIPKEDVGPETHLAEEAGKLAAIEAQIPKKVERDLMVVLLSPIQARYAILAEESNRRRRLDNRSQRAFKIGLTMFGVKIEGPLLKIYREGNPEPVHQQDLTDDASPVTIGNPHGSARLKIGQDTLISKNHCEIVVRDGEVMLVDNGSKNGTYLDNIPHQAAFLFAAPIAESPAGPSETVVKLRELGLSRTDAVLSDAPTEIELKAYAQAVLFGTFQGYVKALRSSGTRGEVEAAYQSAVGVIREVWDTRLLDQPVFTALSESLQRAGAAWRPAEFQGPGEVPVRSLGEISRKVTTALSGEGTLQQAVTSVESFQREISFAYGTGEQFTAVSSEVQEALATLRRLEQAKTPEDITDDLLQHPNALVAREAKAIQERLSRQVTETEAPPATSGAPIVTSSKTQADAPIPQIVYQGVYRQVTYEDRVRQKGKKVTFFRVLDRVYTIQDGVPVVRVARFEDSVDQLNSDGEIETISLSRLALMSLKTSLMPEDAAVDEYVVSPDDEKSKVVPTVAASAASGGGSGNSQSEQESKPAIVEHSIGHGWKIVATPAWRSIDGRRPAEWVYRAIARNEDGRTYPLVDSMSNGDSFTIQFMKTDPFVAAGSYRGTEKPQNVIVIPLTERGNPLGFQLEGSAYQLTRRGGGNLTIVKTSAQYPANDKGRQEKVIKLPKRHLRGARLASGDEFSPVLRRFLGNPEEPAQIIKTAQITISSQRGQPPDGTIDIEVIKIQPVSQDLVRTFAPTSRDYPVFFTLRFAGHEYPVKTLNHNGRGVLNWGYETAEGIASQVEKAIIQAIRENVIQFVDLEKDLTALVRILNREDARIRGASALFPEKGSRLADGKLRAQVTAFLAGIALSFSLATPKAFAFDAAEEGMPQAVEFAVRQNSGVTQAVSSWGMVQVGRDEAQRARPAGRAANVSAERAEYQAQEAKIQALIEEAKLADTDVVVRFDLDFIPATEFDVYAQRLADIVFETQNLPGFRKAHFMVEGEPAAVVRLMKNPRAAQVFLGALPPDLAGAPQMVVRLANKPGDLSALNIPVDDLQIGDVLPGALPRLAASFARVSPDQVPATLHSAYEVFAGVTLSTEELSDILTGRADASTRMRGAWKKFLTYSLDQTIRLYEVLHRQVEQMA